MMDSVITWCHLLNITVNPCMDVDSVRLTGPFWGWNDLEGPAATKIQMELGPLLLILHPM